MAIKGRVNVGGGGKLIPDTLSKLFLIREEDSGSSGPSSSITADDEFVYINRNAAIHKLDKNTFVNMGTYYSGGIVHALNQDVEHLYIGNAVGISKVLKSTLEVVSSGHNTDILSIALEGDYIYCTDGSKNLIKLNRNTLELEDSISIGSSVVYDLALDGDSIYCTRRTDGVSSRIGLIRVDKHTFTITGESPSITAYIDGVDVTDDRIFYIGNDGVVVLDKVTMKNVALISIGQITNSVKQIVVNKKAKVLFVTPVTNGGVGVASTDTLERFSALSGKDIMNGIGMFKNRLYAISSERSIRDYLINI